MCKKETVSPVEYAQGTFPIIAENGDVIVVDSALTELKRYPLNDIFYEFPGYAQATALTRISKAETPEIVIINEEGKITDTIDATEPPVLLHNGCFVTINNGAFVIYQ